MGYPRSGTQTHVCDQVLQQPGSHAPRPDGGPRNARGMRHRCSTMMRTAGTGITVSVFAEDRDSDAEATRRSDCSKAIGLLSSYKKEAKVEKKI